MLYASIAKGYRGGGFNAASLPPQYSTYDGDTVWTYEVGGKASLADGRWMVSSAIYYNDYTDFIGQNALAIGPGGGLVSIDLNLGETSPMGSKPKWSPTSPKLAAERQPHADARAHHRPERLDRRHGHPLATDRLLFQPDWNASLSSDLTSPSATAKSTGTSASWARAVDQAPASIRRLRRYSRAMPS